MALFLNGPQYANTPEVRQGREGLAIRLDRSLNQYMYIPAIKQCVTDFSFCHAGVTYAMWLNIVDDLSVTRMVIHTAMLQLSTIRTPAGDIQAILKVQPYGSSYGTKHTFQISTHKWTHLAVSVSAYSTVYTVTVYINGVVDQSVTARQFVQTGGAGGAIPEPAELTISTSGSDATTLFIDELHIYQYELTPEEVFILQGLPIF